MSRKLGVPLEARAATQLQPNFGSETKWTGGVGLALRLLDPPTPTPPCLKAKGQVLFL